MNTKLERYKKILALAEQVHDFDDEDLKYLENKIADLEHDERVIEQRQWIAEGKGY